MTARYGHGVGTGFLEGVLTEDLSGLRRGLLEHPLWTGLETGETTQGHLRQFVVQDAWLIREVHRLDGLAIAKAPDVDAADHLLRKLVPKEGALTLLEDLGTALGLDVAAVRRPAPLAGCAALTTQFYYHLARSSFVEAVACLGASETIFLEICGRIEAPLRDRYGLDEHALRFFSFHDQLEAAEVATTAMLAARVPDRATAEAVTQAVRLCYETEALFYDTVLAHPLPRATG